MTDDVTDPGQPGAADQAQPEIELTHGGFTAAQQRQLAEWAVEDGTLTPEEADTALRDAGLDPLTPAAADPDSPAGAIDRGFPPASPTDYQLPPLVSEGEAYTPEIQKFDQARRDWLSTGRFPKGIGEAIMRAAHGGAENFAALSDEARELQHRAEFERVRRHFGDDADRMVSLAQQLTEEIEAKHPGFKAWLDETGASSSSFVTIQMALQAARLYDRQGSR